MPAIETSSDPTIIEPSPIARDMDGAVVGEGRAARFIDEVRLWDRHMAMAKIGAIDSGGINRQALSEEDIAARRVLIGWARERGYRVETDSIANLFVTRPGRHKDSPAVATGSHIDSQPRGGRFDGIYGVLAGFEALESLDDAGAETDRPIAVVAWTNEEGSRFSPGAMGSSVFAGARSIFELRTVVDDAGTTLGEALDTTLGCMTVDSVRQPGAPLAAYVEAHIEQGPILERAGVEIGVVAGIQGTRWYEVEVLGRSAHAGTTPVVDRADAMVSALNIIGSIRAEIEDDDDRTRFTIGRMEVAPNSPNTIAERVRFSIDLRHPDGDALIAKANTIAAICHNQNERCRINLRELLAQPPCDFPASIVDVVENAARSLRISNMRMPSGAFHDALFVAKVSPTGMIFVPCRDGVSHNPAEYAAPSHLANGARVLVETLVRLATVER